MPSCYYHMKFIYSKYSISNVSFTYYIYSPHRMMIIHKLNVNVTTISITYILFYIK